MAENQPLVRISAWLSIPIWFLVPLLSELWIEGSVDQSLYILAYGVNVPVLMVLLAVTYSRFNRFQVVAAASAIIVVTCTSLYFFDQTLPERSQAGLLGSIIWFNLIALFVRCPFRTTLFITLITTAIGSAFLISSVRDLDTSRSESWAYVVLLTVTLVMVPGMALVSEWTMRRRYVDEQIIARQRELIRRYAPASVVDHLEHGDSSIGVAQRRRVTILFADVVGFTAMADRLDPEALAEITNDYLGAVAEIIEGQGGTVNEFAGDGVMAIFGAPDNMEPEAQVDAALRAARELQVSLPEWSRRWYRLGIDRDLQARIGINTGVVSVGTFGSAVRATYTGIGLQTNIAARVQSECPPGSVLLAGNSWHLIKDHVACEPRGEVTVKGVHFPIAMYEPVRSTASSSPAPTIG